MRTTLTLDPDVAHLLDEQVHRQRTSFKQVVNDALRRGLTGTGPQAKLERFHVTPHAGKLQPGLDRLALNRLPDELEDEAVVRKLRPRR